MRGDCRIVIGLLGAACLSPRAVAIPLEETRRQVGSLLIESVYDLTGTGVRIGQVESGVPFNHANVGFTAVDPNDVGATPNRTTHATQVAGVMVSTDATNRGMARNASVFSDGRDNNPGAGNAQIFNAITNVDARNPQVLNMSHQGAGGPNGNSSITLAMDSLIASSDFLFVKSAGNAGPGNVTVPGDTFNGLSVGALRRSGDVRHQGPVRQPMNHLANFSSRGTTAAPAYNKPDLVAPGVNLDMPSDTDPDPADPNRFRGFSPASGTSFAAPHVSGVAAQLYQLAPTADHRTMKAALMNAADKTVRHDDRDDHGPWSATAHGLDPQLGAGALEGWGSAVTLAAGAGGRLGVSTGTANAAPPAGGPPAPVDVFSGAVGPDTRIVATVTWDRVVNDGGGAFATRFTAAANQPDLDLHFDGPTSRASAGPGGSVEHINALIGPDGAGDYTLRVSNAGSANAPFSVAYAVSPVDVDPGEQPVYFTVRDQIHAQGPAAARTDRIREGRAGTELRAEADRDATRAPFGVESDIWTSTMDVSNRQFADGRTDLGLIERGAFVDDAIDALSFGRDDLPTLMTKGGRIYFSVDTYATGLSPFGVDNPDPNAVLNEATVVNEAAGDVFVSALLLPGAAPIENRNRRTRNLADVDLLHPDQQKNTNESYADSYFMGQTGPRLADNEDDLNGLEGLGGISSFDTFELVDGFSFFSLDRDSPSGHLGDVLVSNHQGEYRVYATAASLGLDPATDNLDALLLLDHGGLGPDGWPIFDALVDLLVFSVDRDSHGAAGTAVRDEWSQGESPGDLFLALPGMLNRLFLEATDLGLQEVPLGAGLNWLSDNLDALDIPDVAVPAPGTLALFAAAALGGFGRGRRRRAGAVLQPSGRPASSSR